MKFIYKFKIVLTTIVSVLCVILLINMLRKIRSYIPWRVNCWFCNSNIWVTVPYRNSWTCPKCDQYNGFTKDGDYNKPVIFSKETALKTPPKVSTSSPAINGLCKMCNINQQLKVVQLANFVPMNEKFYDEEIQSYRMQLEKAYKLCSPCKKVLQMKLHKEKEILLGAKLIETRTPEKKYSNKDKQNKMTRKIINRLRIVIVTILLFLSTIDFYDSLMSNENLSNTITQIKEISLSLLERLLSIIKMKLFIEFPYIEQYISDVFGNFKFSYNLTDLIEVDLTYSINHMTEASELAQEVLGGFACLLQILGHLLNINNSKMSFVIDLLLTVFLITCMTQHYEILTPIKNCIIKVCCTSAALIIYKSTRVKTGSITRIQTPPKKMKNLAKKFISNFADSESSALDTDDDVSLSQFGLNSLTDSSLENLSPNKILKNNKLFSPLTRDNSWAKPNLNSDIPVNYCIGNKQPITTSKGVIRKSPSSVSDTVFVKPSFNKYQNLIRDDSDSDLDESINSLCIGSPKKTNKKTNSVFSLRKFTATPSLRAPTAVSLSSGRPLISPSKLGHGTSWVAGGYWGSESDRQIFNVNGSRSSSQSSGFESQASSMNQRNLFSQPPSREESDCGEPDRDMLLDRFQNCNMSSFNYPMPHTFTVHSHSYQTPNYGRISYPQMQYNSHVHIPQARFPSQLVSSHQQHFQNSIFKTPGGPRVTNLPQMSSFSSQ